MLTKQFFNKELELNEVQVISEKQPETGPPDTISPKIIFGKEPKLSKDLVIIPPQLDIKIWLHSSYTWNQK
jgi:hypothetical protein